jgi:hypothetical protein
MVKDCSLEANGFTLGNYECARAKACGGATTRLRNATRLRKSHKGLIEVSGCDSAECE